MQFRDLAKPRLHHIDREQWSEPIVLSVMALGTGKWTRCHVPVYVQIVRLLFICVLHTGRLISDIFQVVTREFVVVCPPLPLRHPVASTAY